MKDEKPTFRRFLDRQEAQDLSERLQEAGFDASFHDNSSFHDPIFVGTNTAWFHVLLPPEEFDRANELLQLEAREQLAELPDDHYLHGFTDQELRDILLRQDQWSAEDVIRARHVLSTRGDPISEEAVTRLREARIEELRLPAPSQAPLIIMGWFFTLLGGLVGIGIGWYLNTAKKTLPNGARVPVHRPEDRRQGARMVLWGGLILLAYLTVRIIRIASR